MSIAIIVCDNGLGHMRRSISVANCIVDFGYRVDIYGNKRDFERIVNSFGLIENKFNCIHCDFGYNFEYFFNKKPEEFLITKKIPPLEKYEVVISDNIIEVLYIREDTFLISQFFWHEILYKINKSYKLKCRELIKKSRPIIFGDKYFSMKHIRDNKNYLPTGLYNLKILENIVSQKNNKKKTNLLISAGNTLQAKYLFSEYVQFILKNKPKGIDLIFIDKKIFPKNSPSWVKKATFEKAMFESLIGCICRPGIGTITDCIQYGIKIFTLHEEKNLEMINNSQKLSKLLLGEIITEKSSLIEKIENFCNDQKKILNHKAICKSIDLDGPLQISQYINKLF
tara:strand:- start:49813 stop:50832 length:1020 start_codon:yes stop_codon:yes gene_type:complete